MEIDNTLRRAARNYANECANLYCIGSRDTNPDAWQELFIHHFHDVVDPAQSGHPLPSAQWIERWAFVYGGEA
jgi:hypothetical protein